MKIIKLNEDDILEILLEHYYQNKNCAFLPDSRGVLFGTPGEDLRFIGVYGKEEEEPQLAKCNLSEIDKTTDFNGYHSFLEGNPRFWLKPPLKPVKWEAEPGESPDKQ